jgi:hypothetical protein
VAVYVGNDTIIHITIEDPKCNKKGITGAQKGKAVISETSFTDRAKNAGDVAYIFDYEYDREATAVNAERIKKERTDSGDYKLLDNNCERFAFSCVKGLAMDSGFPGMQARVTQAFWTEGVRNGLAASIKAPPHFRFARWNGELLN